MYAPAPGQRASLGPEGVPLRFDRPSAMGPRGSVRGLWVCGHLPTNGPWSFIPRAQTIRGTTTEHCPWTAVDWVPIATDGQGAAPGSYPTARLRLPTTSGSRFLGFECNECSGLSVLLPKGQLRDAPLPP